MEKPAMSQPFVAVLMGSDSDLPVMESTFDVLRRLGVPFEAKVTSAHRTPAATHAYVKDAEARGCGVFVAAAGMAAHLAGTVAGLTLKPVIGVPMPGGVLDGVDALLSTVQMPGGVPVASVAVGKAGAKNAGYLAAQILATADAALGERLVAERAEAAEAVLAKDAKLQAKLG
jgi:5-(carboxyamino)imidazole ribonucleotide mutase